MILRNYITGSYYGIILQNHYGIILRDDIMELYYGIIFMKRILGMRRTSATLPGIPGIRWARPWEPRGRPWDARAGSWDSRDAPGTPGHAPGTPRNVPETPRGRPWEPGGPCDLLGTTKTAISQQIYSASSSRLLCSKLPMRAHRMNDSTAPLSL